MAILTSCCENSLSDGMVDYSALANDRERFDRYISTLEGNHPTEEWTENERIAYWINAYNAFTIKLIIDNYPVKSIKELGGKIYKVNTCWDIKFIQIEQQSYSLNDIEHKILRVRFNEPRIHFAINCASISCPILRAEAYEPHKLHKQLDEQAATFINDDSRNNLTNGSVEISKIFSWFGGDFKRNGTSIIDYLNKYSDVTVDANASISYKEYDWSLNDR